MTSLQTASLNEIREAAARICRDYLTGRWKVVTAEQLIVKRISGGLSNFLYYISLPNDDILLSSSSPSTSSAFEHDVAITSLGTTTPLSTAHTGCSPDKNSNENNNEHIELSTADCNANKRQRTDSSSSLTGSSLTHLQPQQKEPKEVLLRIYGQAHGEDALEAMITESVVFALLSERNFGPKLHGIFPGGRIEQYIPARPLKTLEMADNKISMKIAEKMGEIHSLNIPMSKEPDWLWNCMNRWLKILPSILKGIDWKENECYAEKVRKFDFFEEAKWLKSTIEEGNYPVLFCHNDLQEGNILFRVNNNKKTDIEEAADTESGIQTSLNNNQILPMDLDSTRDSVLSNTSEDSDTEPDLIIIDFEYCAYNYRGFDLANHFLEWSIDYTVAEFPYYAITKQQYPTKQQRHDFIVHYLKKLNERCEDYVPTEQEVAAVQHEVRLFSMFSHLFWSLWSVVNVTSNIEFGYWNYAVERIREYQLLKQSYQAENLEE